MCNDSSFDEKIVALAIDPSASPTTKKAHEADRKTRLLALLCWNFDFRQIRTVLNN